MRYILRRVKSPAMYSAHAQRPRILKTLRVKRCGLCTYEVPEEDVIREPGVPGSEGAVERCPMCKDVITGEWQAKEQNAVSRIKAIAARSLVVPPQYSMRALQETIPSAVTSITDASGAWLSQTSQLPLTRGGAAKTVYLNGNHFSSTDTITYSTGISDNVPPVVTATKITLSVVASVAMNAGSYSLTFNGDVLRNVFGVR